MKIINMYQAKTNLSQLVAQALDGEEVIIAKSGEPLVVLTPYIKRKKNRVPGKFLGEITIPDNFDDESDEINDMFYVGRS